MSPKPQSWFTRAARWTARISGRPIAFVSAVLALVVWALAGPMFGFSEGWQLTINTVTTIVVFLMVFLIQNTQNRDTEAIQVKLDELIRATQGAHQSLLDLEELEESDLALIRGKYRELASEARADLRRGRSDIHVPPVEPMDGISGPHPIPRPGASET
jgi:low affinity Fe/Cu permease